jgi:hypothetical protein
MFQVGWSANWGIEMAIALADQHNPTSTNLAVRLPPVALAALCDTFRNSTRIVA